MRVYETIFILGEKLEDPQISEEIEKYRKLIEESGGDIISVDNWGKRTLAYEIQKNRRGTYVLIKFQGEGDIIKKLERRFRLDEHVIRFFTAKVEQKKEGKKRTRRSGQNGEYRRGRKKYGRFCEDGVEIDYKNPRLLRDYITERGKILPRRVTGTCAKHQRQLTVAIKRARVLALIPFTTVTKKIIILPKDLK